MSREGLGRDEDYRRQAHGSGLAAGRVRGTVFVVTRKRNLLAFSRYGSVCCVMGGARQTSRHKGSG